MTHDHDVLSPTPAVSALVRRITMRLSMDLILRGHQALTQSECSAMYNLGDASRVLDTIAVLPRMAEHEERARADLLDLYRTLAGDPLEETFDKLEPFRAIVRLPEFEGARRFFEDTVEIRSIGTLHVHVGGSGGSSSTVAIDDRSGDVSPPGVCVNYGTIASDPIIGGGGAGGKDLGKGCVAILGRRTFRVLP